MAAPSHAYTDPTAGVDPLVLPTPQPCGITPTVLWPAVANLVSRARSTGTSLAATPLQAPEKSFAPWTNALWTLASNAFFRVWGPVTRRGWQVYPSGRNR